MVSPQRWRSEERWKYTPEIRVQDGGVRNQSRLVLGASCGSKQIRNHDPPDFLQTKKGL
jgi:hypothetical protein